MSDETLPASWANPPISDCCDLNPKLDKSQFDDAQLVHFVPMPAVEALTNKIDISATRPFAEVKKGYTPFAGGDVLFAKITPCMENGKMVVVPELPQGIAFGSTEFHVIRPRGGLHPLWFFYFLSSRSYRSNAEHNMTGAVGQRRVPIDFIARSPIPLPPLAEQKRIVAKIEELFSELEAGEASLRQARRQLGVYRQSLLKQAFEGKLTAQWRTQNSNKLESPASLLARIQSARQSRYEQQLKEWESAFREWEAGGKTDKKPPRPSLSPTSNVITGTWELPDEWTWANLGMLKLFSLYGPRFSSDDYSPDGVCVLRTSDIGESGKVNLETAPRLKLSKTELFQYHCKKGDLLITRTGSLGTLAVFNDDVDSIPGAYLIHYRLASTDYATYLYHFLKGPIGQAALTGGGAGVGRPNLNAPTIEAIPIPICSLPEQQEIVRLLDEQFEAIERNERELDAALQRSEALRQAILKKAFTGRLGPQDPADEPASALLARLRAERDVNADAKTSRARRPSAAL